MGGDNILQDSLLNGGGLVDIRVWQLEPRLDINACLRRLVELSRARFSSFTISIDMCCGGRLAREGRRCVSDGLTALLAGLEVTLLNQPISPSISFRMLLTNLSSTWRFQNGSFFIMIFYNLMFYILIGPSFRIAA